MPGDNLLYQFGPYAVDADERVLTREGCVVPLTPKAFETLLVLVRNSGHIVEKDDLMKKVWPDAFVEESNLTQNVFALRRILGESTAEPQYIETVPRRGYRFVAPVRAISTGSENPKGQAAKANEQTLDSIGSIAVLPFVNESADAKMEYLSDGITVSLINNLSQLPRLRVMSRNTVFRFKSKDLDPQETGSKLRVDAVLVGRVNLLEGRFRISMELIDVNSGWQLWGENYDREAGAILELQDEITKEIAASLRLRLTGAEERFSKRYTESAEAYKAYVKARHCWSRHTREGLEQATRHFERAINLDPNYALAYAGIVDCYLRLATNYIPPADYASQTLDDNDSLYEASRTFKIRHEWDQKAATRETKRALELKCNYPTAHQWHAAYQFSKHLYDEALVDEKPHSESTASAGDGPSSRVEASLLAQIQSADLTPAEEVQIFSIVAREQIDVGNYEAGCVVLRRWWTFGEWPKLEGLNTGSSADLLLTLGALAGSVASTRQVPRGQKHAEELLNGAIALLQQLGAKKRSAEGRSELSFCYYREGLFDLARVTIESALEALPVEDRELRSLALVRLGIIELHAGRLHDALTQFNKAEEFIELAGPRATGRYHLELATTLKDLGISEQRIEYFDQAASHYQRALFEFESSGDFHRAAMVENNHGFLLLALNRLDEAEIHLGRARMLFAGLADGTRTAQVDDTLARLYTRAGRFELALQSIVSAVKILETGGEEALLVEALTTHGLVLCRVGRHREAKRVLDRANRVAETCGDSEGAGCALLIMIEEMYEELDDEERLELGARMSELLSDSQQASVIERLRKCLETIEQAHAPHEKPPVPLT